MELKDFYALLGCDPNADSAQIKAAWRRESFRCHPDLSGGDPERSERFLELGEAMTTLLDEEARLRYDRHWQRVFGVPEFAGEPSPLEQAVVDAAATEAEEEKSEPFKPLGPVVRERKARVLARKLARSDGQRRQRVTAGLISALFCFLAAASIAWATFWTQRTAIAVVIAASGLVLLAAVQAEIEKSVERHREMARTILRRQEQARVEGLE